MPGYTSARPTDGTSTYEDRASAHEDGARAARGERRSGRRRARRAAGLGATALALCFVLAACAADGGGADRAGGSGGSSPGTATSSAPPPTPSADPDAYRKALAHSLAPLDKALRAVDRAHEGGSLDKALDAAATKADAAADALQTTRTPDDAGAGNSQLATALRALGQDLKSARGQGGRCATSPRVELGTAQSPKSVEDATRALGALGYAVALRLPRTERAKHRRLANGAFLRDGSRGGLGRLTVNNGTGTDAVVTLTRGRRTAFSVYVRRGSNTTIRSVDSGSYTVYFTTGEDWNSAKSSFTRECSFEKFDDRADFRTVRVSGGTQYTVLTFTLNKVLGGNASTSTVPPGEFPS
ncbi:hypothetical protein ACGFOU_10720 [Streptomyces sp. NPDC048595]|uniref:hypothetical protein n=1 Tax=Streptomyces sp. NPDC048595 TaxID=3365576 RepID=UPI003717A1EA